MSKVLHLDFMLRVNVLQKLLFFWSVSYDQYH